MRRIILLLALALPAFGSTIMPMDLTELPGQSSLVILGYVSSTRTILDSPGILEKVSVIRVVTVLRGTYTKPTLRIHTMTGLIAFDQHLRPGDSGVFFLAATDRQKGDYESAYPGSFALFDRNDVKEMDAAK